MILLPTICPADDVSWLTSHVLIISFLTMSLLLTPERSGDVWRHFGCHNLSGVILQCPQKRVILSKMSIVLLLRTPTLVI